MASLRLKSPETSPPWWLQLTVDHAGHGFHMGPMVGSAFHFLSGACQAVDLNAPRVASKFAAWFALSTALEGALLFARQKDDHWNYIASSAAAIGLLSVYHGLGSSTHLAALGGALFTLPVVACTIFAKFEANLNNNS